MSSTSRALFLMEKFGAFKLGTRVRPVPGPGEILVKESAVGLNPFDWKVQKYGVFVSNFPAILGGDAAGEVEIVGEGVTQFKKGDRVLHQGSFQFGDFATFQEYVRVPAELAAKLPSNVTFDEAASVPSGVATAVIALYSPSPDGAGLKAPWEGGLRQYEGQPALILGGSSSVGRFAIQFTRLSGFSPIITTASLRNTNLLKSLGATHIIDRNISAASFASEIANITTKPITLAFDAVSSEETQQLGYDTLAEGGHIALLLPSSIKNVSGSTKTVVQVSGFLDMPANRVLGCILARNLPSLLESGDIVPSEVEVIPGGLNGIVSGLQKLENNLVSARKLIVRPGETV